MSRRKKIIIITIIVIVVLLLIIGLFWWFWQKKPSPMATNTNQGLQIPDDVVRPSADLNTNVPPGQAKLEAELKAIAMTFAERFGSYSNESNFSNLDDLKSLMTIRMKAWAESYKAEKSNDSTASDFSGVTTQALSGEIQDLDESIGRAEILVNTQRRQAQGNPINPEVYYQKLKLRLVKSCEGWKVDSAEWQ